MIQSYATLPEPPLSLAIRMDRKRKRIKIGIIAMTAATALLAGGAYNFTISGSELIAGWLTAVGVGVLALGITLLARSSKQR